MIARIFLIYLLSTLFPLVGNIDYVVEFYGVDEETSQLLSSASQLELLKCHPPASFNALKRRIDADLSNLSAGLQTLAYYHPVITTKLIEEEDPVKVQIYIETGPVYLLEAFELSCGDEIFLPTIDQCGILIDAPAYPAMILNGELAVLAHLAKRGYPLASIQERKVIADETSQTISVDLKINAGPPVAFGTTTIHGLKSVEPELVYRKIGWIGGDLYDPKAITCTQAALEESGLFNTVTITSNDSLDDNGQMPMIIELSESKHRTLGFGLNYNTQLGAGITAEWEHRNVRGIGEKISLSTDLWHLLQRGEISYKQPDFLCINQDLFWIAEMEREVTSGFTETFLSISAIAERRLSPRMQFSYGAQFKELDSTKSNNNGTFSLVKIPLQVKYSDANHLLDPTYGHTLHFKFTPTYALQDPPFTYYITSWIGSFYYPLTSDERVVLASKMTLGSIFGASDRTIPPPERFYAGSENTLRGYKYLTVSPLDEFRKPLGGRSMMVYSIELRTRLNDSFGGVLFYEVGNVYSQVIPQFDHKQLQSLGVGLRYLTPVGPLRLDLAFPLNPRKGVDKPLQLYFSIGQAF